MNLSKEVKVTQVLGYTAAGVTAVKAGTIIDMAGYEGCMFIFSLGTLLTNGVLVASVTGNSTSDTGGTALAATATHTVLAAENNTEYAAMVVDVYQPDPTLYRYLEAIITPTVSNVVILGIIAIQYNGKLKPELTSSVLASTFVQSPAAA